jgi:hypothetical protein
LALAMTIKKFQRQASEEVGVYLLDFGFGRDQFDVELTRRRSSKNVTLKQMFPFQVMENLRNNVIKHLLNN